LNHFIKTTLRDYLNENSSEDIYKYSKRVIYDHINNFLEKTYYSNVKYRDLINSCDLSKGDNTTTIRQRLDFANELAIETGLSKDFILGIIKNRK